MAMFFARVVGAAYEDIADGARPMTCNKCAPHCEGVVIDFRDRYLTTYRLDSQNRVRSRRARRCAREPSKTVGDGWPTGRPPEPMEYPQ